MNALKRDLNFFTAYKKGSPKAGKASYTSMIVIIVCFILVVSISYGILYFVQYSVNKQIETIKTELNTPKAKALRKQIDNEVKKNMLLVTYYKALDSAKKNYDSSRVIDSKLLDEISKCAPGDIKIQVISINPQSVMITGICFDNASPAVFAQALRKLGIFSMVESDGFVYIFEDNNFTFGINCFFGEIKTDE